MATERRSHSMAVLALIAVTIAVIGVAACTSPSGLPASNAPASALDTLLLAQVGNGYARDPDVSGSMSLDSAAYSTPASPDQTRSVLASNQFTGAASGVWRHGTDYVTDAVYAFDRTANADRVQAFLVSTLTGNSGAYVFPLTVVPNGSGFVLDARNKTGSKFIFCEGAIFSVELDVFLVETCGAQPNSASVVSGLAEQQYRRAIAAQFSGGEGSPPVASPGTRNPTPSG